MKNTPLFLACLLLFVPMLWPDWRAIAFLLCVGSGLLVGVGLIRHGMEEA